MKKPEVIADKQKNGDQTTRSDELQGVELTWAGKKRHVDRVVLPFQAIEVVNESRATREDEKRAPLLKSLKKAALSDSVAFRNKLIWGDNKYVIGSLLEQFSGQINLVYIDPPFASGQDFSFSVQVGDQQLHKEPSLIEEKAYRDTWGLGMTSYLQMFYERIVLIRELLVANGTLYVHLDWHVGHYAKAILDEVFGDCGFANEVIWRRINAHNSRNAFGQIHDVIFRYVKSPDATFNVVRTQYAKAYLEKRFTRTDERGEYDSGDLTGPGTRKGESGSPWFGFNPTSIGRHWQPPMSLYNQLGEDISHLSLMERLDYLYKKGYIIPPSEPGMAPRAKVYAGDGLPLQDIWAYQPHTKGFLNDGSELDGDVAWLPAGHPERIEYDTQKPEGLLKRIVQASSNPNDLVADFFCGSGTTLSVAEKLGRRWLGCDLSRWAIQVTRKRLLDIKNCRPFEVLNLGKYERQYWQGVTFGSRKEDHVRALHEYVKFILDLYRAEPVTGLVHLHGQSRNRMIHVGSADSPVTLAEIRDASEECRRIKQDKLDILGWEWEMGLHDVVEAESRRSGINLRLLHIPRECMDPRAVEAGDVHFYELAYLEVEHEIKGKKVRIRLKNFVIPSPELIPDEVRKKIKRWSDFIDYWAVDFVFDDDVFHNQWQDYRTRSKRELELVTDWHDYGKTGRYKVLVKVFDIFGNDTTHLLEVKV